MVWPGLLYLSALSGALSPRYSDRVTGNTWRTVGTGVVSSQVSQYKMVLQEQSNIKNH